MKKIFTIILGWLGILVFATPVLATTNLLLTPATIDVAEQEHFTLMVSVSPKGIKNYTAKVELEYPADLLEVESFAFASNWLQLNQPGYDLIDNTNGLLIKTGGFPGGVSELITFGTVLFSAKKTGEGIIKIGEDSLVLDAENQNVLIGPLVQTSVTIAVLVPPEEEVIPPEEEVLPPKEEVIPPPLRPLFDILIEPVAKELRKWPVASILAAIGVIILIVVAYVIYRRGKKRKRETSYSANIGK